MLLCDAFEARTRNEQWNHAKLRFRRLPDLEYELDHQDLGTLARQDSTYEVLQEERLGEVKINTLLDTGHP